MRRSGGFLLSGGGMGAYSPYFYGENGDEMGFGCVSDSDMEVGDETEQV